MAVDRNHKIMKSFFRYMIAGFLILCFRIRINDNDAIQVVHSLFFTFWYIFIVSIWIGMAGVITMEIYDILKKNSKGILNYNLCYGYVSRLF